MENFFINGTFYKDLFDVLNQHGYEYYHNIPDDFKETCYESVVEPIFKLGLGELDEYIFDSSIDRISDRMDGREYFEKIMEAVEQSIDINKLNSLIPTDFYKGSVKFKLVKEDFKPCFLNIDLSSFDNNEL